MEADEVRCHYSEAGMALAISQVFERAFIIFAKLAAKHAGAEQLSEVTPVSVKAFKQPVKAILNEMREASSVSDSFLAAVERLVEARHTLVHRASEQFGWPNFASYEAEHDFVELCHYVIQESEKLANICGTYIGVWASRFPEMLESVDHIHRQFNVTEERVQAARRAVEGT